MYKGRAGWTRLDSSIILRQSSCLCLSFIYGSQLRYTERRGRTLSFLVDVMIFVDYEGRGGWADCLRSFLFSESNTPFHSGFRSLPLHGMPS